MRELKITRCLDLPFSDAMIQMIHRRIDILMYRYTPTINLDMQFKHPINICAYTQGKGK